VNYHELNWCLEILSGVNRVESKYLSVEIDSRRMSGEMNTSLSNGFANLMLFKFLTQNTGSVCVVEGDDCLARIEGPCPTAEQYAELGFRIKIETYDDLGMASFCGLLFDLRDRQLFKEPTKAILNFGWSNYIYLHASFKTKKQLAKSKAMSFMSECPHSPIIGCFALRMYNLLRDVKCKVDITNTYVHYLLKQFKFVEFSPTLRTRLLFHQKFGISLTHQLLIESRIVMMEYCPIDIHSLNLLFTSFSFEVNRMYVREYSSAKLVRVGANNKMNRIQQGGRILANFRARRVQRVRRRKRNGNNSRFVQLPTNPRNVRFRPNGQRKLQEQKSSRLGLSPQSIGALAGTGLGSAFGPAAGTVGGLVGRGLGYAYEKIMGRGDYEVKSNSLVKSGPVPEFPNANCIRFKHREYIADVQGSVGFALTSYPINPGLSLTYPMLSAIASCFQQYTIVGQIFEFMSTSANALNSTNTALGTVIMATDYDAVDSIFVNKQSMMATTFSNAGKPSESLIHPIECNPRSTPIDLQYVRTGPVVTGSDQRLYDLGLFEIATQGMQAVANIGELWVSYDVILCKPVLSPLISSPPADAFRINGPVVSGGPFLVAPVNLNLNPGIGGTISGNTYTFPSSVISGVYLVTYTLNSSGSPFTTISITPTNGTALQYFNNNTLTSVSTGAVGNISEYALIVLIKVTSSPCSLLFSGGGPSMTNTNGDLIITQTSTSL